MGKLDEIISEDALSQYGGAVFLGILTAIAIVGKPFPTAALWLLLGSIFIGVSTNSVQIKKVHVLATTSIVGSLSLLFTLLFWWHRSGKEPFIISGGEFTVFLGFLLLLIFFILCMAAAFARSNMLKLIKYLFSEKNALSIEKGINIVFRIVSAVALGFAAVATFTSNG